MELNGIPQYLKNKEMSWQKKDCKMLLGKKQERLQRLQCYGHKKECFKEDIVMLKTAFKSEVR